MDLGQHVASETGDQATGQEDDRRRGIEARREARHLADGEAGQHAERGSSHRRDVGIRDGEPVESRRKPRSEAHDGHDSRQQVRRVVDDAHRHPDQQRGDAEVEERRTRSDPDDIKHEAGAVAHLLLEALGAIHGTERDDARQSSEDEGTRGHFAESRSHRERCIHWRKSHGGPKEEAVDSGAASNEIDHSHDDSGPPPDRTEVRRIGRRRPRVPKTGKEGCGVAHEPRNSEAEERAADQRQAGRAEVRVEGEKGRRSANRRESNLTLQMCHALCTPSLRTSGSGAVPKCTVLLKIDFVYSTPLTGKYSLISC